MLMKKEDYIASGKWVKDHSYLQIPINEVDDYFKQLGQLQAELKEEKYKLQYCKARFEEIQDDKGILVAQLDWWHGLIRKYHKNYARSNLKEIVQDFIDRAEKAEAELDEVKAELEEAQGRNLILSAKLKIEKEVNRWIPVAEGLPEEHQEILVLFNGQIYTGTCFCRDDAGFVFQAFGYLFDKSGKCLFDHLNYVITHWKPIILPDQALKGGN